MLEGICGLVIMILRMTILIHRTWMWSRFVRTTFWWGSSSSSRERERTIHLHQRNTPSPPSFPHSCLSDLGGWHALSSKRQEQRTRRITEGCGSSLKHFRGLSISSVSYKSENKVSAACDAELIRWSQDAGWRLCTFTKRSIKDKDLNIINHCFASTEGIQAMM